MSKLINPETLPTNFDLSILKDPVELAKYEMPESGPNVRLEYTSFNIRDKIVAIDETSLLGNLQESVAKAIADFEKRLNAEIVEIPRIYIEAQYRPKQVKDDNYKLQAIKAIIARKKAALAQKERRKKENLAKAQRAAAQLKALGVEVTLPEILQKKVKAKK